MKSDRPATPSDQLQDPSDLELMFQSAPIGMCCFDTDLRYVRINQALAAINGRSISDHIGRTLGEILPEMAPTVEPAFHQVLQTGKPILNHDVRGRLPFDPEIERCWICNYYPLVSPEGAVRGVACTVQEVTERTRADEARQKLLDAISQAHSGFILGDDPRTLFDGLLSALLALTDSEYGFIGEILRPSGGDPYLKTQAITNIAWNEETRAFYAANAPSGLEFLNLQTLFGTVITTGETVIANEPSNDPRRGGTPEGHPDLNAFLGLPLHLGDQLIGMIGVANRPGGYDEETVSYLQPLLGTCSHLIAADRSERTRKKADEEFKQRGAELQQAQRLESLGMLAGGIAHDFNNMLTPILGYAELLIQSTPADDPRREDLEAIQKAGEEARVLTQQLLAFSRKQVLEFRTVHLGEVVVGYEKTLRRLVREDIDLDIRIEAQAAWIEADDSRLGQVLLNLAVNAQDAMPLGGRLSLEISDVVLDEGHSGETTETKTGPYVVLSVTDTGEGMDEDRVSRVFDPFYSTKERGKGTGLGLATVHGIVQQHNGWIEVRSEPGEGTTFKLYFPRADEPSERASVPLKGESIIGGAETVLVVEDEEMVRSLVSKLLMANGYTVLEAEDGEDALLRLAQHDGGIDLLLTDVVMPKMGGRELYQELRMAQPGLKVLFVSGYTDGLMDQHDVSEPGAAFLAKPFSATSLPRKVREVLDGGSAEIGSEVR